MKVSVGRRVLYCLTEADRKNILESITGNIIGNEPVVGQEYPVDVTRVSPGERESINGHLLLDAAIFSWLHDAEEVQGEPVPGYWRWPPVV